MNLESYLGLGYTGLFLLSLVSNIIPYSSIPYLVFIAPIISKLRGLDLVISIISIATGATLGKIVVYFTGRFIARFKYFKKHYSGLSDISRYKKAVFITVFLVASLPIPDDVFYVPIGASRYNIFYFSIALFAGKLVISILTALYGVIVNYVLEEVAELPLYIYIPIMLLTTYILIAAIGKINWYKVEEVYGERGLIHALRYILYSFVEIVFIKPMIKFKSLISR